MRTHLFHRNGAVKMDAARKVARRVTEEMRLENAGPKISRALTVMTFASGAALTLARMAEWNRAAGLSLRGRREPLGKFARTAFASITPRAALGLGAAGALTFFARRNARAETPSRWMPFLIGALATWEAFEGARGAWAAREPRRAFGFRARRAGALGGAVAIASALALPGAWLGTAKAIRAEWDRHRQ